MEKELEKKGIDKKIMTETMFISLINEGIPKSIINRSPAFIFCDSRKNPNLNDGHLRKENQILEMYGGYTRDINEQIVPDRYDNTSNLLVDSLSIMEKEKLKDLFQKRDNFIIQIEELKQLEIEKLKNEKNDIISSIAKYKMAFPIIDKILEAIKELGEKKHRYNVDILDIPEYVEILKKNGLDSNCFNEYDKIYKDYNVLLESLNQITERYNEVIKGKIENKKIEKILSSKVAIEEEIIKGNTKLINNLIKEKYSGLLVEQDDLFQICYFGLWNAVKDFNYKKNHNFLNYAYYRMDLEVKINFEQLTGYNWETYWIKKKIQTLLKNSSEILERKVSLKELIANGFLGISEQRAITALSHIDEYPISNLFPVAETTYDENETKSEFAMFYSDDEIKDYEEGKIEQIITPGNKLVFANLIRENISEVLDTLSPKEAKVIMLRYGLIDNHPKTLEQIGKELGLPRERVRQIESKALRYLRNPLILEKLKTYVDYETWDDQMDVVINK